MQNIIKKVKCFIIENELINKGDLVVALNSFGKDSSSMVHILNRIKDELHFELISLNIQYPKQVFSDEEVNRIVNYWESIGVNSKTIKIPDHIPDITNFLLKDCLYCKKIRRDFVKKEIEQYLGNHDRIIVATAHNYWDLIGYYINIAFQTKFFSNQPKNQDYITEMLGRFSPKNDFGKIQLIRPILFLSNIDAYRYAFEYDIQRLSSICKNRDLRPKRKISGILDDLDNEGTLDISYESYISYINKININEYMKGIENVPWETYLC